MQPINDGYIIVGKYVENIRRLQTNKLYVLILKEEGVVYKRVIVEKESLILISDNSEFLPYTVSLENILETCKVVVKQKILRGYLFLKKSIQ